MKIGSLFAGIGGLELGLELAGVGEVVWQVEINAFARGVLAMHWPKAKRFEDVTKVGARELAGVDVICGGFPCQDISVAGRREGITGARSGLWKEFHRIIQETRPRFVVIENVARLVTEGLDVVVADLDAAGYRVEARIISAADVGAPHRRERLFIIAERMENADGARCEESAIEGSVERSASTDIAHGAGAGQLAYANGVGFEKRSVGLQGPSFADSRLADSSGQGREGSHEREQELDEPSGRRKELADAGDDRREVRGPWDDDDRSDAPRSVADGCDQGVADADSERVRLEQQRLSGGWEGGLRYGGEAVLVDDSANGGRGAKSRLGGSVDGLPGWVDRWPARPGDPPAVWEPSRATVNYSPTRPARVHALGNAVVPRVAMEVGARLLELARRKP